MANNTYKITTGAGTGKTDRIKELLSTFNEKAPSPVFIIDATTGPAADPAAVRQALVTFAGKTAGGTFVDAKGNTFKPR